MQKGSALPILLLILVVAVLGSFGGIYFFSNLKKPKIEAVVNPSALVEEVVKIEEKAESPIEVFASESNTQKFTSNQLKFEFIYDKELSVSEDTEKDFYEREKGDFRNNFKGYIGYDPAKFTGAVNILDITSSYQTNPLTIWAFENPENLSIEKWYENYWYYPFVWGDFTTRRNEVAPIKDVTIAGEMGKYGVVTYRPSEPKFIYIQYANKMFLFRAIGENSNKILESFKFL